MTVNHMYFAIAAQAREGMGGFRIEDATTHAKKHLGAPQFNENHANASIRNANHWIATQGGRFLVEKTQAAWDRIDDGLMEMLKNAGAVSAEIGGPMYGQGWFRDPLAYLEEKRIQWGIKSSQHNGIPIAESLIRAILALENLCYFNANSFHVTCGHQVFKPSMSKLPRPCVLTPGGRGLMKAPFYETFGAYYRLSTNGHQWLTGKSKSWRHGGDDVGSADKFMPFVRKVPFGKYKNVSEEDARGWFLGVLLWWIEDADTGDIISCISHDATSTKPAAILVRFVKATGRLEVFSGVKWQSFRHDRSTVSEVSLDGDKYHVKAYSPRTGAKVEFKGRASRALRWGRKNNHKGLGLRDMLAGAAPTVSSAPDPGPSPSPKPPSATPVDPDVTLDVMEIGVPASAEDFQRIRQLLNRGRNKISKLEPFRVAIRSIVAELDEMIEDCFPGTSSVEINPAAIPDHPMEWLHLTKQLRAGANAKGGAVKRDLKPVNKRLRKAIKSEFGIA